MITRGRLTVMKKAAHFHVEQTGHERLVNTLHSLEVIYGIRTTEAENDIEQATNIARRMVTRWGMSDELDE
jgi:ATP-dependent Zn protease